MCAERDSREACLRTGDSRGPAGVAADCIAEFQAKSHHGVNVLVKVPKIPNRVTLKLQHTYFMGLKKISF